MYIFRTVDENKVMKFDTHRVEIELLMDYLNSIGHFKKEDKKSKGTIELYKNVLKHLGANIREFVNLFNSFSIKEENLYLFLAPIFVLFQEVESKSPAYDERIVLDIAKAKELAIYSFMVNSVKKINNESLEDTDFTSVTKDELKKVYGEHFNYEQILYDFPEDIQKHIYSVVYAVELINDQGHIIHSLESFLLLLINSTFDDVYMSPLTDNDYEWDYESNEVLYHKRCIYLEALENVITLRLKKTTSSLRNIQQAAKIAGRKSSHKFLF
jgi:hypothetical protein